MNTENKSENVLSPAEEKLVRELVLDGREKGFVTLDEINENLGDETPSAEQLEKIFNIFAEMDIEVIDSEKKMDIITDQTDSGPELDFEANDLNLDPGRDISSREIFFCCRQFSVPCQSSGDIPIWNCTHMLSGTRRLWR